MQKLNLPNSGKSVKPSVVKFLGEAGMGFSVERCVSVEEHDGFSVPECVLMENNGG